MKDKVVSLDEFKQQKSKELEKIKEKRAEDIVLFILNCDELSAIEYLSRAYIEYLPKHRRI